ncbi:MAG: peptidylprolyl isomerase, partial [Bacteroidota bacterium]
IYERLKAGEKFEDLARQFSDDQSSGKNGGLLPWFGVGRMVPEFEIVAFSLKYPGDYSEPIRTSYGWHIVKLMETKPIPPFESMQGELKQRVLKDSRSELSKTSMINKIKAKYGYKENVKARVDFEKCIDSTLTQGIWTVDRAEGKTAVMFTLGSTNYSQQDFAGYLADHQSKRGVSMAPVAMMNSLYNEWVDESCITLEESKLDSLYPDFRNLMQEYRDGILLFELMDKKVWSKAVKDTAGLKSYYESNKTKYMWPDRLDASIYTCANAEVAKEVYKQMKKIDDVDTLLAKINASSQLNLQVRSSKFSKGESDIIDQIEWKEGTTKDMVRNGQVVFVVVNRMLPSQPKSIDEAKGIITADYQSTLEREWIAELQAKYPVNVNQKVVESVYSAK